MCVNNRLMQIQADLLGVDVVRPVMVRAHACMFRVLTEVIDGQLFDED
jgi:glycerol kinase